MNMKIGSALAGLGVLGILVSLLVMVLIAVGPFLLIWTLNTLFLVGIPYTFKTWLAAFLLGAAVSSSRA